MGSQSWTPKPDESIKRECQDSLWAQALRHSTTFKVGCLSNVCETNLKAATGDLSEKRGWQAQQLSSPGTPICGLHLDIKTQKMKRAKGLKDGLRWGERPQKEAFLEDFEVFTSRRLSLLSFPQHPTTRPSAMASSFLRDLPITPQRYSWLAATEPGTFQKMALLYSAWHRGLGQQLITAVVKRVHPKQDHATATP